MDIKLVLAKGEPKGKVVAIDQEHTTFGRDPDCDVVIASPQVSRKHCRIDVEGDTATLVDLGSKNGTYVNGQKAAEKVTLSAGDKLVVGPLGFVVEAGQAAASEKPTREFASPATEAPVSDAIGGDDLEDFLATLEDDGDSAAKPGAGTPVDEDIIQLDEDEDKQ